MKTQQTRKTGPLALALGASLLASTQTAPAFADAGSLAARLPVQEKFEFGHDAVRLSRVQTEELKTIPDFARSYSCRSGERNALSFSGDVNFPFITWSGLSADIPLNESFFEFEEHFFGSNSCGWDGSKIRFDDVLPVLETEKPGSGFKSELTLERLSPDGARIDASYRLKGDFLKNLLITRHDELVSYLTLYLMGCSTEDGVWVTGQELVGTNENASIRDLIAGIRAKPLRKFVQCMLGVSKEGRITPEISKKGVFNFNMGACGSYYGNCGDNSFSHFMIQEGAEALYRVDSNHKYLDEVPRSNSGVNPAAETTVKAAMEDFISWLKGDYLDFIDQLNARDPNAADRSEALRAFAQRNKGKIASWLSTIDENLKSLPLMAKMSVLMNINQAYQAVGRIEREAQISEGVLDRVIRKNSN